MDNEDFGTENRLSSLVGRYRSFQPFPLYVRELRRCGECEGLYKQQYMEFKMGVHVYPLPDSEEAIERQMEIDEHNRELDIQFYSSNWCHCYGRNDTLNWLF